MRYPNLLTSQPQNLRTSQPQNLLTSLSPRAQRYLLHQALHANTAQYVGRIYPRLTQWYISVRTWIHGLSCRPLYGSLPTFLP